MAQDKFSDFPTWPGALAGTEQVPIVTGGLNYKVTTSDLFKTVNILPDAAPTASTVSNYRMGLTRISDGLPYSASLSVIAAAFASAYVNLTSTAHIDPVSGSDSNPGTLALPLQTFEAGVAGGYGTLYIRRNGTCRPASPQSISNNDGLTIASYAKSGDTQTYARIWFSTNVPSASWTSAAPTYVNLYYIAATTNPGGVWEVSAAGVVTRMPAAVDAATANATPGSHFYDSGAQRLYVYPIGGVIAGKSYEVPAANTGLTLNQCNGAFLCGLDIAFSRDCALRVNYSTGRSEGCYLGHCGNIFGQGNALEVGAGSVWGDIGSTMEDAGNDGVGMGVGAATFTAYGTIMRGNGGDGISSDAAGTNASLFDCTATGNGKNGYVRIASGTTRIIGGYYAGNVGEDVSVNYLGQPAATCSLTVADAVAEWIAVEAGALGAITSTIRNVQGTFRQATQGGGSATSTVDGLRFHGDPVAGGTRNQTGVRADGGSVTAANFYFARMTWGAMATGTGTLTLKCGSLLRSTSGAIFQNTGTLVLDGSDPINAYPQTFTGVSAPNIALTIGVNTV